MSASETWDDPGSPGGTVQLSLDLGELVSELGQRAGWPLLLLLDKGALSPERWAAGILSGQVHALPWGRFAQSVLLDTGNSNVADLLDSGMDAAQDGQLLTLRLDERSWLGGGFAIFEGGARPLGRLLVLPEVTELRRGSRFSLWVAGLAGLGAGASLLLTMLPIISRIERRLSQVGRFLVNGRAELEVEVVNRTRELTQANQNLQREIHDRDLAEQKLLRQQMFLVTVLDSLAYPFLVIDAQDFGVKLANKAAIALGGAPVGSQTCFSFVYGNEHPCVGTATPCVMREVLRRKGPVTLEHSSLINGKLTIFEVHAYPIFSEQGRLEQIIEQFIDITDRKLAGDALVASERNYRELVEAANGIVMRWDRKGLIRFMNGFGRRLFGYSEDELIGHPVFGTVLPTQSAESGVLSSMLGQVAAADPVTIEQETVGKDGVRVWISWTHKAIRDGSGRLLEVLSFGTDITQRRVAMIAVKESEARFRNIFENSPLMMFALDEDGRIVGVNRKWVEETGYTVRQAIGRPMDFILAGADDIDQVVARPWREGGLRDLGARFVKKGGQIIDVQISCNLTVDPNGRKIALNVVQDVSERRRFEEELRLSASVFESSMEGIVITDSRQLILRVNRAFLMMTGFSAEEVVGQKPSVLASGRHDAMFFQNMWQSVTSSGFWQGEIWNRRKNGEIYPQWLSISTVFDERKTPTHYIGAFTDISDKKISDNKIYHLAHYDALTDLPNRVLFQDRLDQALVAAARGAHSFPILFLDLDRFKPVNDSLGHPVGDLLLQQVAQRLRQCVRQADTVARMGGDEFTVLLARSSERGGQDVIQTAARVARTILKVLERPFDLEGYEVFVSASIGIAIFPQDGSTAAELVKNADIAMYGAKARGRNSLMFFEPKMNAAAADRLLIESNLRRALDRGEFELYYQPTVGIREGRIESFEALIRWRHPELGMVAPDVFIPLAEETGLIVPIGNWVLREAVRQVSAWRAAGHESLRVAVNLSLRQFRHRDLINVIRQVVGEAGQDPSVLAVEVTESAFMEDEDDTIARLREIAAMGVQILIDDFGTGYSSLARLRALPIHVLKIDRSFVRDITTDPNDASIIAAIIAMAHTLQLKVIAEGVETVSQLKFLKARNCEEAQGYLFSPPIPAKDVLGFLQNDRKVDGTYAGMRVDV